MNGIIASPFAEGLALVIEQDAESAPKEDEGHVQHDGRNIAVGDDPGGDKLAETVAPQILVDGDGDENAAGHRFVAVDGVCRCNGGNRGDLDTCAGISDDDDHL